MFKQNDNQIEFADGWYATKPCNKTLDKLNALVKWSEVRDRISKVYSPQEYGGRPGFDPVVVFKLILLEHWYNLSDGRVLEEAADRLSFRRFLGINAGVLLPDDTTLVKFRHRLQQAGILKEILNDVNACIQQSGFTLTSGTIVDATLVKAHTRPRQNGREKYIEPEADKTRRNGKAHFGYKVHLSTDVETNVIKEIEVTPASKAETEVFEKLLEGDEPEVYADKGYTSKKNSRWLTKRGIKNKIMKKGYACHPLKESAKKLNRVISRVRNGIERKIGEMKLWHGLGRMRYVGLARSKIQAFLTAIVVNLKFLVSRCVQA